MMNRPLFLTVLLLTSGLLPLSAAAYVTPEEILDDESYTTRFYDEPPSRRSTQDEVARQQAESAERREAEQNALNPQSEPEPSEEENLHGAAPEEESDIDKLIQLVELLQQGQQPAQPSPESEIDPVDARLLERIKDRQDAAARAAVLDELLGDSEQLHSGAPLADTGPAAVIVTLAVTGALGETWRRVRKAQREAIA